MDKENGKRVLFFALVGLCGAFAFIYFTSVSRTLSYFDSDES